MFMRDRLLPGWPWWRCIHAGPGGMFASVLCPEMGGFGAHRRDACAAERVLADCEARGRLLARRPSDMSVSGATLRQVNQTTADAISAIAAAESELQPRTSASLQPATSASLQPTTSESLPMRPSSAEQETRDAPPPTASLGSVAQGEGSAAPQAQIAGVEASLAHRTGAGAVRPDVGDTDVMVDVEGSPALGSELRSERSGNTDDDNDSVSAETLESIDIEDERGRGDQVSDGTADEDAAADWEGESTEDDLLAG